MLTAALIVFFVFTFAIAAVAVVFVSGALDRTRSAAGSADSANDQSLFKNEQLSSISLWQSLLVRFDFGEIMRKQIAQADLDWSVGRLTLSMLLCGAVVFAVISSIGWVPLWAQVGAAWLASLAPYGYVLRARSNRFRAFTHNFPDALDTITRAMKSGYPLVPALDLATRETAPPVASEIRQTYAEINLGAPVDRALANFCERMPLVEVGLFSAAVQLHSRTGGRLTDILAALSENIREQTAFEGEVRALAAQGRVTGILLTVLPLFIAGVMAVVSPMYIGLLLGHPYGKHMIAAAVFCLVIAHLVIRRIVDIRI
jgi:tight adherence protein B